MYSIIVFSKDRPLQLHAYLESLQHFSDAKLETISVLYCKTPNVNYEKVINAFPQIQWIEENNFYTNLLSLVSTAKDKILFGCDDVVFTDHFSIETASSVLDTNDQIFGFSFRLGTNIQPLPYKHAVVENNIIWNWMIADTNQYNYPWELDCTLYRKTDIEQMIAKLGKQINNPNYFEEYFAVSPLDYINKPLMACSNKKNNAVVITVNRVQETHKNAVDENSITNVHYLNKIYNENGNTLDILKISKLPRNIIHVDRTYFILRNKIKQIRNENKYIKKLKQLIKNVKFILNHSLSELNKQSPNETANTYELIQLIKDTKLPKIKNSFDTIEELLNTNKSFCRFGDGEISLIYNNSIPFQKSNHLIAARLKEIIKSSSDSIMIGIGYYYFYPEISLFPHIKKWIHNYMEKHDLEILNLLNFDKQYYDTFCTQLYMALNNIDFEDYFQKIRMLWDNKDITIICGDRIFNNLKYNIFDNAKSIEYQYCSSEDAFYEYEEILAKAKKIEKNKLIFIILGPTATILAYDLANLGYRAIDFGHIAKDFNAYKCKINNNLIEDTVRFFDPD